MPLPEIEEFARVLIQHVRDEAIASSDRVLKPNANHEVAKRWNEALPDGKQEETAKVLIPDIVDNTIFYLLHAIDDGLLNLSFTASNGNTIHLGKEGNSELAGWYMGSGGWRALYANERFVDDLADLA